MTDSPQTPQPARLLDCGWCYEEQGEEVHPHPECPIGRPAVVSSPRAILREAADRIDATREPFPIAVQNGIVWAVSELRRLADEAQPERPGGGLSARAGLRDEIVNALGQITTVPPIAHRRAQADNVLAVLYRAWPWLRAEAEDAAAVGAQQPDTETQACPDPIECDHEAALGQAQEEARRLGLMVDEYSTGASALTDKLKRARDRHRETCILALGQVQPTAFRCGMCEVLDAPAVVQPGKEA